VTRDEAREEPRSPMSAFPMRPLLSTRSAAAQAVEAGDAYLGARVCAGSAGRSERTDRAAPAHP
jgi:hypothetical protein